MSIIMIMSHLVTEAELMTQKERSNMDVPVFMVLTSLEYDSGVLQFGVSYLLEYESLIYSDLGTVHIIK